MTNHLEHTLIDYFNDLSDTNAKIQAGKLTTLINESLMTGEKISFESLQDYPDNIISIIHGKSMSSTDVSSPWAAYNRSINSDCEEIRPYVGELKMLVGVPNETAYKLIESGISDGVINGNIGDSLASAIKSAKQSIIIAFPYWGKDGVDYIFRRLRKLEVNNIEVRILTSGNLDKENKEALQYFVNHLKRYNYKVYCRAPSRLQSGHYPLMHTKLLISDNSEIYIGSANFTGPGLTGNYELGLSANGAFVSNIVEWMDILFNEFEPIIIESF